MTLTDSIDEELSWRLRLTSDALAAGTTLDTLSTGFTLLSVAGIGIALFHPVGWMASHPSRASAARTRRQVDGGASRFDKPCSGAGVLRAKSGSARIISTAHCAASACFREQGRARLGLPAVMARCS
jgi:hypothetical protein